MKVRVLKKKVKKVVVVGGGVAGLTASLYLLLNGHDVTLIEKNSYCGGLVNSFNRESFTFDGGVPALLNAGIILPMLKEVGIDLKFVKNKVSVGIDDKIVHVKGEESFRDYVDMLKEIYPDSVEDIERLALVILSVMNSMKILYSVDNPLFVEKKEFKTFKTYLPWLLKLLKTVVVMKKFKEPVEDYVGKIVRNESLKDIITQHFVENTPAFFALSYFYAYTDYIYPENGIGELTMKMEEKIRELGGEIVLNTEIEKLDVDKHLVLDGDGRSWRYDKLIWAADLKRLCKIASCGRKSEKMEEEKDKVLSGKTTESVVKVFIAVDQPVEYFEKISNAHFFYTPSKEGIGEIEHSELENLKSTIRNNFNNFDRNAISEWIGKLCKYTSYEISIPALRNKNLAPEGKTGLIVNFFFDYELAKLVHDAGWYDDLKNMIEENVIEILSNTVYPGLKDKVIFKFSSTPLTIARYVGTTNGAIVGWAFGKLGEKQPIKNSLSRAYLTAFPDIYKAGQWAYSPAGVPMAILTGKLAAEKV